MSGRVEGLGRSVLPVVAPGFVNPLTCIGLRPAYYP